MLSMGWSLWQHTAPKAALEDVVPRGDGRNTRGPSEDAAPWPRFLLTLPRKRAGHLPGLGLPWAAPEATVRDWGFMGSPGAEQLPALGTWI